MIDRTTILESARSYLATPYHHQGRLKGVGVDCLGLILGIAHDSGISLMDKKEFLVHKRRPPRGEDLLFHLDEQCVRVWTLVPGDIAVFWLNPVNKRAQHLAIVTDKGIVHTDTLVRTVVEEGLTNKWKSRILAAYEMPGVLPWRHSHLGQLV